MPSNPNTEKFSPAFLAVFFIFWSSFYMLFARGVPSNGDPVNYFVVAQSIVERGTVALERNEFVPLERGKNGAYYSKFGIGQSLAEAPFYWVGRLFAPRGGNEPYRYFFLYFASESSVPVICALICVFFALLALELGYTRRAAAAGSFILGLGTLIWPYAKIGFSEPLQGFALLGAFLYALRSRNRNCVVCAATSGLFAGALILTKTANLITVPLFLAYLVFSNEQPAGRRLFRAAAFLAQIAIFLSLQLIYNNIRFGSFWDFGYNTGRDAVFGFSVSPLSGLYGFLLSPGKSIFVYSPVLVAALIGAGSFHRRRREESLLLWAIVASVALMYGRWWAWHGDWCWGPRFLVPLVPLLLLPALPVLEAFRRTRAAGKAALLLLIGISIYVQVLGVSVNFYEYIMISRHQAPYEMFYAYGGEDQRDDQLKAHFVPEFSPVAGHAWLLKHTLLGRGMTQAELRERMQSDFPWRSLMRFGVPQTPERGVGFDFWWIYMPRFFPESACWARTLASLLAATAAVSLAVTVLLARRFPAQSALCDASSEEK